MQHHGAWQTDPLLKETDASLPQTDNSALYIYLIILTDHNNQNMFTYNNS